ncbi:MAG: glycosyltransferase family 1 protein [Betaproteobacteria bacterium]
MLESSFLPPQLPAERPSLRVAVVTETYPPEVNGVAMTLGRMVSGLHARSHHVQLIRPRQGIADAATTRENFEEVLKPGLPIPRYDSLRMGLPARQGLLRLWRDRRPDVVQVATEGPLGWSAISAARKLRIPVASDFHTNFHSYSRHYGVGWLDKPIAAYLRRFHNQALVTMVPTHQMRDELSANGYRNVRVVARGVDTRLFSPARRSAELRAAWGAGDEDVVVLVVGRLAPEKNLPVVVTAFAAMRRAQPRVKLVFVGDGPERPALARTFPQHVFAGMRTGEDLARHYASGDVFLFASVTETFGNVTLEAMASGLAVIAYDYAAARQHIRNGHNGLLAPFDQEIDFVRLAEAIAPDRVRLRALGRAARQSAEQVDWEIVYDDLERVLATLAAGDGPLEA